MEHPITHIGVPEGQNGFLRAVITFVFQWQNKTSPCDTHELTCLAFGYANGNQEAGPRPSTSGRKPFIRSSFTLVSIKKA